MRGSGSNNILGVMSTPRELASDTILKLMEPEVLKVMTHSVTGTENIQISQIILRCQRVKKGSTKNSNIWKVAAASHVLCWNLWPLEKILIQAQRWGFTTCYFLCSKDLLKYNRDRVSFFHRHQKGTERVPACQLLTMCFMSISELLGLPC